MSAHPLRLRRTHDDLVVCDRMSLGESFSERFLGLMGRGSMDAGEGLYLKTSSIHMMFMRFPIDALFVAKADERGVRKVVGMRKHLPPWRGIVMPIRGAEGVVEMPAGTLERCGIAIDDAVVFDASDAAESEVSTA
jgi:uncharacterized membrane protein (UPF0127 family)